MFDVYSVYFFKSICTYSARFWVYILGWVMFRSIILCHRYVKAMTMCRGLGDVVCSNGYTLLMDDKVSKPINN